MKTLLPALLLLGAAHAAPVPDHSVGILRQKLEGTGITWDMPATRADNPASASAGNQGTTLAQLWSIDPANARDHLLDHTITSPYLPKASIKITTLDPDGKTPRTRVDQPFTLHIELANLLTGAEFPLSASSVLLERSLIPASPATNAPADRALLASNGKTVLRFPASALTAADPTKASGQERFAVHAIPDGSLAHTQLASATVQVWPVASGTIQGIQPGATLQDHSPRITLHMRDLYPRSNTRLILYQGTQINGNPGITIHEFPIDLETTANHSHTVPDLSPHITRDGTHTLALVSETIFGCELLCDPVTFTFQRSEPPAALASNP